MDLDAELDLEEQQQDPGRLSWENFNGNDQRCQIITGFACEQFLKLYEACDTAIPEVIGRGRTQGRETRLPPNYALRPEAL